MSESDIVVDMKTNKGGVEGVATVADSSLKPSKKLTTLCNRSAVRKEVGEVEIWGEGRSCGFMFVRLKLKLAGTSFPCGR